MIFSKNKNKKNDMFNMKEYQKKYNISYYKKNRKKILRKMKKAYRSGFEFACIVCDKKFRRRVYGSIKINTKCCSKKCMYEYLSLSRIGENNPAYRNGSRIGGKSDTPKIAQIMCNKYRENFIDEHGYIFCEKCGRSDNGRYEVHHIFYRSEKPKHENLHKSGNLIMLCVQCHNDLHSKKAEREKLDKFITAKTLFNGISDNVKNAIREPLKTAESLY